MNRKFIILSFISIIFCFIFQGIACARVIKFIQVTDVHYNNEPYRKEILTKTVKDINKQKGISFVIFTGDNVDSPKEEHLEEFVKIVNHIDVPYYLVIGNHDVFKSNGLSKQRYIEVIKENNFFYKPKKANYVIKKGGFVFIIADGAKEVIPGAVGYYREDTLDWVEKQLKKYKNRPAVIVQHFPLVEPKKLKSHETYKKDEYLTRLDKYNNVIAVVSGHFHTNGENMRNGVYHISSPSLMVPPNEYKIIEISTSKKFSPIIYTELKQVSPEDN